MNKRNVIIIVIAVVTFAGVASWAWSQFGDTNRAANDSQNNKQHETTDDSVLRIIATGDMIAHDSVIANAKQADGSYDFFSLMQRMEPYFAQADVRFCNEATPAGGEQFGISGYPVFNAPLEWHDGMQAVGCNVINLGTNHTNDKGQALINAMVSDWQARDNVLATAGAHRSMAEREEIAYFELRGVTFALLSYSTYSNDPNHTPYGLVRYDETVAQAEITEAKANADIVMVSMRWGTEYADEATAADRHIAQTIAEAGADFVFGHGPHTLQPVERINTSDNRDVVVWYSLGNFLNTQIPAETLIGGFAVMDLDIDTLELQQIGFLPVYSHYEWSAEEAAAQNLLARRNLQMYPLDEVDNNHFARNQLDTTVQAEREALTNVLNRMTEVKIFSSSEYLGN